jgi:hypothetical protein
MCLQSRQAWAAWPFRAFTYLLTLHFLLFVRLDASREVLILCFFLWVWFAFSVSAACSGAVECHTCGALTTTPHTQIKIILSTARFLLTSWRNIILSTITFDMNRYQHINPLKQFAPASNFQNYQMRDGPYQTHALSRGCLSRPSQSWTL